MNIKNLIYAALLIVSAKASAQDCTMPVAVRLDSDFANIPDAACSVLYQTLSRIATENGLSTDSQNSPFVLTAHCDVIDKSNLPGPPVQTIYNIGMTLYIADTYSHKKFATSYIVLNGAGTGEVKSYIDAFKRISAGKAEIQALMERGKANMMEYYNTRYQDIISEARRLEALQDYEEALTTVLSIPDCSKGGKEASRYALQLYTRHLDRMNLFLLNRATGLWNAGQNQETAYSVCFLLSQIDPDASCYADAVNLMKDVKSQVRSDIDFEMRQKYNDRLNIEKDRISAAKAVGVAFGNGQKSSTTNLMWLK